MPGSVLDAEVKGQTRKVGSLIFWHFHSNGRQTINK